MKSSFGRSFFTAAAILLVAMTILGASFQIKVNQFLTDTTVSGLQQNADTIAELAAAYFNNGGMYNRSFQLNLTVASQVSGADAVVCDSEGNVVLCSDAPSGCEHQGLQLNQAYLQKVIRSGGDTATGGINGRTRWCRPPAPCTPTAATWSPVPFSWTGTRGASCWSPHRPMTSPRS